MSAPLRFAVPAPGKAALIVLLLLAVLLPGAAIALAFAFDPPASDTERWILPATLAFVLLVGGVLAALLWRRSVELVDGMLVVRAAMYTRRVPVSAPLLDKARRVDLREHREYRPAGKTNGYSLPGFQAGHFRLRNREPAFVLVTDPQRVLVLPVRGDRLLLLSLAQPDALLQALRRHPQA